MGEKFQFKGIIIWIICSFFFLYEFLLRTILGSYQYPLMNDLVITSFQFSLLSTTIFSLVYGLMQVPVGLIVDNLGLKKSLLISAFCCALSSIGFAYADNYFLAIVFRVLMGFGASFGFICLLVSIYEWIPLTHTALFIGLSQFIGTMGPMFAAGPLESLSASSQITWRLIFLYLGILGVVLLFLIFLFVENKSEKSGKYKILYRPEKITTSIKRLFLRAQPWYIAIVCSGLYFSIEYLSENEGRAFLESKGISEYSAGYMITIAWIGYAIGCPLFGFISDYLEKRKFILSISAALLLLSMVMLLYLKEEFFLQLSFFLLGVSAGGQSAGYAAVAEQFKKQFIAIGFGLVNATIMIVSSINAPLMALALSWHKKSSVLELSDYLFVFNAFILIILLTLLISTFLIKETFCKSAVDFTILNRKKSI